MVCYRTTSLWYSDYIRIGYNISIWYNKILRLGEALRNPASNVYISFATFLTSYLNIPKNGQLHFYKGSSYWKCFLILRRLLTYNFSNDPCFALWEDQDNLISFSHLIFLTIWRPWTYSHLNLLFSRFTILVLWWFFRWRDLGPLFSQLVWWASLLCCLNPVQVLWPDPNTSSPESSRAWYAASFSPVFPHCPPL